MTHKIEVQCDPRWSEFENSLRRAALETLDRQSTEPGTLSIVLIDSAGMQDLNRKFAGDDYATDVLSFVDGSTDPDSGQLYFGDVVIAVDIAQKQAEAAGHPLATELSLLSVHGVLHLLGYDHAESEEKAKMWSVQSEILEALEVETGKVNDSE